MTNPIRKAPPPPGIGIPFPIHDAVAALRCETARFCVPIVTIISREGRNPFHVLISTLLSLRTKDACTAAASERLFRRASDPRAMAALSEKDLARIIYPVGFYNTKAVRIHAVCRILLETYGGHVPTDMDALLALPGVGRKTANLVLTLGFGLPGICVDTHVHRITNRWGYVKTRNPEETEFALRKILPPEYWIEINDLLVTWGQNVCAPVSPRCSSCVLAKLCARIGVLRSR
ncbi:MAG TPA: endonuclease III [Candidatus Sumerlaeota bacterium]|nr:endonuclease III [Candidatus Sumerlaeota bacterium]